MVPVINRISRRQSKPGNAGKGSRGSSKSNPSQGGRGGKTVPAGASNAAAVKETKAQAVDRQTLSGLRKVMQALPAELFTELKDLPQDLTWEIVKGDRFITGILDKAFEAHVSHMVGDTSQIEPDEIRSRRKTVIDSVIAHAQLTPEERKVSRRYFPKMAHRAIPKPKSGDTGDSVDPAQGALDQDLVSPPPPELHENKEALPQPNAAPVAVEKPVPAGTDTGVTAPKTGSGKDKALPYPAPPALPAAGKQPFFSNPLGKAKKSGGTSKKKKKDPEFPPTVFNDE